MTFRDIKRQARTDVHAHMKVAALYIAAPADPVPVDVRIHTNFEALGDVKGTNFQYAERHETVPKIVFMRDQVEKPARGAVVSVATGEAYKIDNILPPDDITVTAEVARLTATQADGLPTP